MSLADTRNLLSISALEKRGVSVCFSKPYLVSTSTTSFPFSKVGNLYIIESIPVSESHVAIDDKLNMHRRMGHNCDYPAGSHCEECAIGKAHRQNRNTAPIPRKEKALDLVYSDVAGPMDTTSIGGMRYAISFIDSYSRYARVYFMKSKGESLDQFKLFCSEEGFPKIIRSDNGGEYSNKLFFHFCISKCIKHEFTNPYSPHQNGVAERRWRTSVEMSRCLLASAGLGKEFWVRALDVAFHTTNRCQTSSLPKGKTALELFHGQKPNLSYMKVFGCTAYTFTETHQTKLSGKATKQVL